MATPPQPNPQQIAAMQQQLAAEAAKRGMSPQEFSNMQRQQLAKDAAKHGLTPEQYIDQLKAQALQQHQQQQQAQQQQQQTQGHNHHHQHSQQVSVKRGAAADPKALAVAKFLKSQDLKPRTCILDGQRKDMFKVKRALRALQSPAYTKASSKKGSLLPPVNDLPSAENAFALLPLSLLALRVSKTDPHAGHDHAPPKKDPKRVKGLWTVKIEQQQDAAEMSHYVWLWEGPQWKQKAMAGGVLVLIMAVIMFPLWPIMLRQGVWYLSVGMMGLLGLFFAMAIFRLILFCVTVFAVPPGLWLFPNLFEDVGFFDSFKPLWAWQENKKKKTKSSKKSVNNATGAPHKAADSTSAVTKSKAPSTNGTATTTATSTSKSGPTGVIKRDLTPRVEEVEED